jgi:hypothetical protein
MKFSSIFLAAGVLVMAAHGTWAQTKQPARPRVAAPKPRAAAPAKKPVSAKPPASTDVTIYGRSGLPLTFYQTWNYGPYIIYMTKYNGGKPTVTNSGGTLSLGPNGTYEKKFSIPGPYGPSYFNETGKFQLRDIRKSGEAQSGKITFIYTGSDGKPISYGGTFSFGAKSLSLALTLNESAEGKEIFGLLLRGTENLRRRFDENGRVVFE